MICPNCKREVPDTAKACGYCGHWLADEAEATVQVPEETAATVAVAEAGRRSPGLWIGAGLIVLVLLAVVGLLAYRAGRRAGTMHTRATLAAALAATRSVEATSPAAGQAAQGGQPAGVMMYDDFDDPAFDGDYDKGRWRRASGSPGEFVQEAGLLVVTQDAAPGEGTRLVARDYDFERLETLTVIEAQLKLDPEARAGNVQLALEAEVSGGEDWWWTECALYEDWLGCYADLGFEPEGIPVKAGEWHTVRIEVEPATMIFTYYLDGRVEGTFAPPNAEALKSARFAPQVGVWRDESGDGVVGYVDEVRIERVVE